MKKILLLICGFLPGWIMQAQLPSTESKQGLATPKNYVVRYTSIAPAIDGDLVNKVWKTATWSDFFQDIEGAKQPKPRFKTHMKMLWSDTCLYVAAELQDPHVWANLKEHDEIVYHDNDFEVFIDPDGDTFQYFEIEINAFNTIFDLSLDKPYRKGGKADHAWNATGLVSAVKVHGTINNSTDQDKGWTLEMAIPFRALTVDGTYPTPKDGSVWRMNFSRVEWKTEIQDGRYEKQKDENGKKLREDNWVWSPQGIINMHYPERWGYIRFVK